jgi:hypothetical protein
MSSANIFPDAEEGAEPERKHRFYERKAIKVPCALKIEA